MLLATFVFSLYLIWYPTVWVVQHADKKKAQKTNPSGLTNLTVVDAKIHPLGKAITSGQVKQRYDMVMCYDVTR